jgi:hypothetical protein
MTDDYDHEATMRAIDRVERGLCDMLDELNNIEQTHGSARIRNRVRTVLMHVRLFAMTHDQKETP